MRLSLYQNFPVFDLFGIFQTPFFVCVQSHKLQKGNPIGRLKAAQKSPKTFKILIEG